MDGKQFKWIFSSIPFTIVQLLLLVDRPLLDVLCFLTDISCFTHGKHACYCHWDVSMKRWKIKFTDSTNTFFKFAIAFNSQFTIHMQCIAKSNTNCITILFFSLFLLLKSYLFLWAFAHRIRPLIRSSRKWILLETSFLRSNIYSLRINKRIKNRPNLMNDLIAVSMQTAIGKNHILKQKKKKHCHQWLFFYTI